MEKATKTQEQKKFSYEELNEINNKLIQDINYLQGKLQQADAVLRSRRLDYLFECLKYENTIKNPEFIASCVEEITKALMPIENSETEK